LRGQKRGALTYLGGAPNGEKAVSGNADTAFEAEKSGFFGGWRFTAR
jgi:hypothetical protein